MESKKFNWNKLLNGLIAGIAIILASVFIGLCFIVPTTTSVKASLKKSDIEREDRQIHESGNHLFYGAWSFAR